MSSSDYDTITVEVPIPPKALHPNSRTHWRAKMAPKKKYRDTCAILGLEATKSNRPQWPTAKVRIRWRGKSHQTKRMDQDNAIAALKAAFDGLTDAGVWKDDKGVSVVEVTFSVDAADPRVEIICECAK